MLQSKTYETPDKPEQKMNEKQNYVGPERRTVIRVELSDEQINTIVERVYDKLYIQIGKNVVRQALFLLGTIVLAASAYVAVKFGIK